MRAVGDENALASTLETLLLKRSQLLEEAGNVNNGTSTDKVDTRRGDQARGKNVEIIGLVTMDNSMARIWNEESIHVRMQALIRG